MEKLSQEQFLPGKNAPTPPDIKLINKLTQLEAQKAKIEEKLLIADEDEKKFLEISLESLNKQIQNYHDSFGVYQTRKKYRKLDETAEKELGKEFVDDYKGFKNRQ